MPRTTLEPYDDPLEDYAPIPPEIDEYPPLQSVPVPSDPVQHFNPIELAAERSILSAVLTTPKTYDDLCDKLVSTDFGAPSHEAIWAAIVACDHAGKPFDKITVADEMNRAGTLGTRWGYLEELVDAPVSLEGLDAHVAIVLDRSLRRRMVKAARAIGQAALNPAQDAASALDVAEQEVFALGDARQEPSLAPLSTVMSKTQAQMANARTTRIVGRSTGIARLDEITGGLRGGQLIIIAARPAMGKSVLGLQIADHIAEVEDLPVPFYSYEMTHEEIGIRLLAASTGISMNELNRGYIPSGDGMDRRFADAVARLSNSRLLIDDKPPATVTALRSDVRRLARRGQLGAVVVDYLQLLEGEPGRRSNENRTQEVAFISRTLKMLAVELNVPIIAISQLSRACESRPNKRPILSDLRESGSLEQDSNLVLALYREWVYDRAADERHGELLLLKNRQGPLEEIAVDFDGPCARFLNTGRGLLRNPAGPATPPGGATTQGVF